MTIFCTSLINNFLVLLTNLWFYWILHLSTAACQIFSIPCEVTKPTFIYTCIHMHVFQGKEVLKLDLGKSICLARLSSIFLRGETFLITLNHVSRCFLPTWDIDQWTHKWEIGWKCTWNFLEEKGGNKCYLIL